MILRQPLETESTEPITEQDNELLAKHKEYRYMSEKMTWDPHCYECKVRYRDPKAKDLVMYLHAWRYKVHTSFSYRNAAAAQQGCVWGQPSFRRVPYNLPFPLLV